MPEKLSWLDNRRLGYLAPADAAEKIASLTYVVHDVDTGEVLAARSGVRLHVGSARRHVAFVAGEPGQQALVVDGKNVWPRAGLSQAARRAGVVAPTATASPSSTKA